MKKQYGKILIGLLVACLACVMLTWFAIPQVFAANYASRTIVLPSSPSVTYDAATYILLFDINTGNFVNASTGASTATTAWADADIATAAHTYNTVAWVATIPALNSNTEYGLMVFSGTSYSASDTYQFGPVYYNPATGKVFTDTNPISQNAVISIPASSVSQ